MKKKTFFALALCAVCSFGAVPVPHFESPAALAATADRFTDASLRFLPLTKRTRYFADGDQTGALLNSYWTSVDFFGSADSFNNVANALADYSMKEENNAETARAQMTADAAQERAERQKDGGSFYGPFERTRDVYVRRADSRVVSLLELGSSYTGGVHGSYGAGGESFDTRTGKKLVLSDVCPDTEGLIAAIIAQLGFDYPNASFMQSGSTLMPDMVRQMVSDGSVAWTVDARGVSFYFNPYLLGSYAEGIFSTTLLYSQHPELFMPTGFGYGPAEYAMELCPYLVSQLSDSPRDHHIRVGGDGSKIFVSFGGETIVDEVAAKDIHPVVVGLSDGRQYLYVDCLLEEEGRRVVRVYDLNLSDVACIGVQPMTLLASPLDRENDKEWYVMTNPQDFIMTSTEGGSSRFPTGTRVRCRVGSDGRIEMLGEG